MIKITPDFPCIHCGACAKACSHGVIKMVPNEEGKLIPRVSFSSCRYCRACRWARLCRGGCRRDRQGVGLHEIGQNYFCHAYLRFFEYAAPKLATLL